MKICICPYCGSSNTKTTGGENGNPFDRRPEKTICLDCGRTISEDTPPKKTPMPDLSGYRNAGLNTKEKPVIVLKKPYVVIEMTAKAAGVTRKAKAEFPYEDGEYSFK